MTVETSTAKLPASFSPAGLLIAFVDLWLLDAAPARLLAGEPVE